MVFVSNHAQRRQVRRNLSNADISFVQQHGQRFYCAGVLHTFLGRRNIPGERDVYQRHAHLEGTVLVLHTKGPNIVLITAYRNRLALKAIRSKTLYNRQKAS